MKLLATLASGLVSATPQLVGKIPSIISSIKSKFTSVDWGAVGLNIIKGIAAGIAKAASKLVDAAVKAATDALDWVKNKLGINSPSRVWRDEVGVMMARGAAIGVGRAAPALKAAASSMVDEAMPARITTPKIDTDTLKASLRATAMDLAAGTASRPLGSSDREERETAHLRELAEDVADRLDGLIELLTAMLDDDRPFTQRDFARLVRSLT